jgi:hypothetical protein
VKATFERGALAFVAAGVAGLFVLVSFRALRLPDAVAFPLAGALVLGALVWISRRLPASFDGALRRRPVVGALAVLLGLATLVQTARLSAFMLDDSRTEHSVLPFDKFSKNHACLTAYVYAVELNRRGTENLYKPELYPEELAKNAPRIFDTSRFTHIDKFQYPPPFLLLPRALLALTGEFATVRAVWFLLQGLAFALGLVITAVWLRGREARVAALLAAAVWVSIPTFITLQMGNFHLAAVAMAMLAMVAFESGHRPLGGALLAFSTLAKLFPGVLVLHLLLRRRFREVAWTGAFAVVFTALAALVLGTDVFSAFLGYQLPRLLSGEAFSFIETGVFAASANLSISGIVYKLGALGVDGMTRAVARPLGAIYAAMVVGLTAWRWKRSRGASPTRLEQAQTWLALLNLAALISPFAPYPYAAVGTLWLLSLLAPELAGARWVSALVVAWLLASLALPPAWPTAMLIFSLVSQAVVVAVNLWAVLRGRDAVRVLESSQAEDPSQAVR